MLITPKTKLGRKVRCVDPYSGEVLPAFAADTTEGWVDLYLRRPAEGKLFVDRKKQRIAEVRLHTEYDIVTKRGRKLISVRWTMTTGDPRCIETKHGPLPK